jgi:hypothetical protein
MVWSSVGLLLKRNKSMMLATDCKGDEGLCNDTIWFLFPLLCATTQICISLLLCLIITMAKDRKSKGTGGKAKKAYKIPARKPWVQHPTALPSHKLCSMRVYAEKLKNDLSARQKASNQGLDCLAEWGMSDDAVTRAFDNLPSIEEMKAEYAALLLAIAMLEEVVGQDKPLPKEDEDDENTGSGSHESVAGPFGGGSSGLAA